MKKLLLSISLFAFLACGGNNFKIYSLNEKKEILKNVILKENQNSKKEYNEIRETLLKAMNKGNENAKKELDEWDSIAQEVRLSRKTVDVSGKKSNVLSGWGN